MCACTNDGPDGTHCVYGWMGVWWPAASPGVGQIRGEFTQAYKRVNKVTARSTIQHNDCVCMSNQQRADAVNAALEDMGLIGKRDAA